MPRKRTIVGEHAVALDFGTVTEKQKQFLNAKTRFVCYGGARGGGKSHISRIKCVGMCMAFPGIKILFVRAHYPELNENIVRPILRWVPEELYSYNHTDHIMTFTNGSVIKFGHYDDDNAEQEYQGLEYDCLFIEEATQFSERAFQILCGVVRGTNTEFPHRVYLTCNPGGVGHRWVKRLFISKQYITDYDNPERTEDPKDYTFIFATVEDNKFLLEGSPFYLKALANLPEDIRAAHRYGDWDALSGSYFKEFNAKTHTVKPFRIPDHWTRYRSIDYGLDMFVCLWWAVDEDGRSWCYREFEHSGYIVDAAVQAIKDNTPVNEKILLTYAPPDIWNRQKDTGKSMAELFTNGGVPIVRSDNNRVQGHIMMKSMMQPIPLKDSFVRGLYNGDAPDKLPELMFFDTLKSVVGDIGDIQADEDNPNDCAKMPHDVTHSVDACRYYCISRTLAAEAVKQGADEEDDETENDYESYMCGGEATSSYLSA